MYLCCMHCVKASAVGVQAFLLISPAFLATFLWWARPVGQLMAPYMAISGELGPVTSQQSVVLLAVFSEPVTGLLPGTLRIAGPPGGSITALKLLANTATYYQMLLTLPAGYYGPVTVALAVRL